MKNTSNCYKISNFSRSVYDHTTEPPKHIITNHALNSKIKPSQWLCFISLALTH